ncbi:MAG: hypothetical protein Q7R83_02935 [bacterium]|nr:hypothetical protein [bacterium]
MADRKVDISPPPVFARPVRGPSPVRIYIGIGLVAFFTFAVLIWMNLRMDRQKEQDKAAPSTPVAASSAMPAPDKVREDADTDFTVLSKDTYTVYERVIDWKTRMTCMRFNTSISCVPLDPAIKREAPEPRPIVSDLPKGF